MNSTIKSYIEELQKSCIGGTDIPDIIKEVPNIFKTLQSLIKDPDLINSDRLLVFAAIGYFFIPDDLFPEEKLGQIGYIDDVILCLTIFQQIYSNSLGKSILERNWYLEFEILHVLGNNLASLTKDFPTEYTSVLDYVGLYPDNIDLDIK